MCVAPASSDGSDRRSFSGIRRESGATPTVGLSVGNSGGSQNGTAKRRATCVAQTSSDAIPGGDRGRRTGAVPQPPTCPKARVGEPWLRGRGRGGTLALLINKRGRTTSFLAMHINVGGILSTWSNDSSSSLLGSGDGALISQSRLVGEPAARRRRTLDLHTRC